MFTRRLLLGMALLLVGLSIACAAAPTPVPTAAPPTRAGGARAETVVVSAPTKPPMPTMPPSRTGATAYPAPETVSLGMSGAPGYGSDPSRKIIKNAQLWLTVEKVDTAVDRVTGIVGDVRGYITSSRTFSEGGLKAATITVAVPVDRFEEVLQRLRGIALKVEQENASGQDVSDEYVDLESQLRNLQATAERIRDFLKRAQTVEEALKVNQQLSQVEKEIETIKGKLNYLSGRSTFSTITVELREPKPTPTPTPVPMVALPMPTPTPTVWNPGRTVNQAVETQTALLRALTDLLIWLIVVVLPYALGAAAVIWVIAQIQRWLGKSSGTPRQPPTNTP